MNDHNKKTGKPFTIPGKIIFAFMICAATAIHVPIMLRHVSMRESGGGPLSLTPWQCIGGCGAGGSGGGSSGIRWIGEGVSGALLDLEILPKINFGQTVLYSVAEPRLSYRPRWATELGLSMPIGIKEMEVQYQTNMDQQLVRNGTRGDLTGDVRQLFGGHGQYAAQFSLTFPTGQYDAERGTDLYKNILPQSLQMGRGVYSGILGLSYTRDNDRGMFLFDGYLSYPFMIRLDKKNQYLTTDYRNYAGTTGATSTRFYYKSWLKPYGESDRGDYYPPSASFDAIYAYRGVPKLVQSFQLFFSAPMGVRWIHSYDPTLYDPRPDPDNRAWDLMLCYGMEFSRVNLPVFAGVGLPIHAKRDISGRWDAPDWENVGQEWIIALGFKAALY